MLIEEGTPKEFKAAVLDTCDRWPQYEEIYAVNTALVYPAVHPNNIEHWVLEGVNWRPREMVTHIGERIPLPLKPQMEWTFRRYTPRGNHLASSNTLTLSVPEWERMLAYGYIKFIGFTR